MALQALDLEAIGELQEIVGEEASGLYADFLRQTSMELEQIRQHLQANELEHAQNKAHQIKGVAANLGIVAFAEQCRLMEEGLRSNSLQRPQAQMALLEASFQQAAEAIRAHGLNG